MVPTKRKIELLAPARDLEAARAAVDFGADAIYTGGPAFGARTSAANAIEDVARMVGYARPFGVRVYAALNTLVYENEIEQARQTALDMIAAGVDALIIQDTAFLRMGLEGVEFHASTQMQNTTPEWVALLEKVGFSRVILERGLTLQQIKAIREGTTVQLETFVHGAICVGHSGRCYLSRSTGPRSGNRGDCSQPCRLPWDLVGPEGPVIKGKHLLSMRDLNLTAQIPALMAAGVDSFKIEGRLKDASYVKNIVAHYRRTIDRTNAERASWGASTPDFEPDPAKSFSRGATVYYINGKVPGSANFETPKATGEPLGKVVAADRTSFTLDRPADAVAGDGLCFLGPRGEITGTNVNRVEGTRITPASTEGIKRGMQVLRNRDHRFETALSRSRTRRTTPLKATLKAEKNLLTLTLDDHHGRKAKATLEGPFETARDTGKALETLRTQISKTGDSPYTITEIDLPAQAPFVPVSQINDLRRRAIQTLTQTPLPRPETMPAEDLTAKLPTQPDGCANITNSLAESFYKDHGAEETPVGWDKAESLKGARVMQTPYCIRREIGQCLIERHTLKGPLSIRHGQNSYDIEFDCKNCQMILICR